VLLGGLHQGVDDGLLGDALARTGEHEQAVEILAEGVAAFPGDDRLRRKLAIASAKAGLRNEAVPLLTSWVESHPADSEASFALLALLFEGFARETSAGVPGAQREQLVRHARAYADGNGPNREVIACWLRYLEARPGG